MGDSRLPTEVELVFEVMPCNALRTAQEPGTDEPHEPEPDGPAQRPGP
jgi:hypothetical protein